MYRAEGSVLCFSQRSGGSRGNWSAPSASRLPPYATVGDPNTAGARNSRPQGGAVYRP
eukprot:COSAG03_NODE_2376_length_2827_cov_5.585044_4_plen_58_part_00